jgi:hypothetical protein
LDYPAHYDDTDPVEPDGASSAKEVLPVVIELFSDSDDDEGDIVFVPAPAPLAQGEDDDDDDDGSVDDGSDDDIVFVPAPAPLAPVFRVEVHQDLFWHWAQVVCVCGSVDIFCRCALLRVPVRSGKWMLFPTVEQTNETWRNVQLLLASGGLGLTAKCSVAPDPALGRSANVICIYTRDYEDVGDVARVLSTLRERWPTSPLNYKTDDATRSNVYEKDSCLYVSPKLEVGGTALIVRQAGAKDLSRYVVAEIAAGGAPTVLHPGALRRYFTPSQQKKMQKKLDREAAKKRKRDDEERAAKKKREDAEIGVRKKDAASAASAAAKKRKRDDEAEAERIISACLSSRPSPRSARP